MKKMLALINDDEEIMLVENTNRGLSFDYVKIAKADDTIYNYNYMHNRYDDLFICLGKDNLIRLCDEYNCLPSKLVDALTKEAVDNQEMAMEELECSLYPEIMTVNDTDYIFISRGCGSIEYFVDKVNMTANDELYEQILKYKKAKEKDDKLLAEIEKKIDKLDDQETFEKFVTFTTEK